MRSSDIDKLYRYEIHTIKNSKLSIRRECLHDELFSIDPKFKARPYYEAMSMTEFAIKTRPEIIHIGCRVGSNNCMDDWKSIITPMGVCSQLELKE